MTGAYGVVSVRVHTTGCGMTYEDTEHARCSSGETVARPAVFGREELRRDGVQNTVHYLQIDVSICLSTQAARRLTLLKNE